MNNKLYMNNTNNTNINPSWNRLLIYLYNLLLVTLISDKSERDLTIEELNKIDWTKYKIIVPTEKDKKELEAAFKHIHYSDIDTDFITVNQLAHEYLNDDIAEGTHNNIIVDDKLYKSIENR